MEHLMPRYSLRITLSLTWLALIAACASAPSPVVTTSWRDPSYNGPPFKKIFVVGLSAKSLKDQRGFENLIVYTLQGAGITAVPGWQYVPTDRTPDQATMRAAIVQSGADAALLVRLSGLRRVSWCQPVQTCTWVGMNRELSQIVIRSRPFTRRCSMSRLRGRCGR